MTRVSLLAVFTFTFTFAFSSHSLPLHPVYNGGDYTRALNRAVTFTLPPKPALPNSLTERIQSHTTQLATPQRATTGGGKAIAESQSYC